MMDSNEFVEQTHAGIPYITPTNVCDAYYDVVIILVVKGNLKHRIEKLGRISADSSDESISDTDETHRTNKQTKSKQIFTSTN